MASFNKTTLQLALQMTMTEVLDGNVVGLSDLKVKHSTLNLKKVLDADSTPPVTKVASFLMTLDPTTHTLDLEAIPGTNDATVVGTGLKVQAIKIVASAGNANIMTITEGAGNAYLLAGASWSIVLAAGQEFVFYGNDATPAIAGGSKDILFTGTDTQTCSVTIALGA